MDTTLSRPPAGQLLDGRYRVEAWLAHGGMATVYLGTDTRLDRSVALKIAHPELAGDEEFIRRFIGEARSVARLSSPHVVAVYDQGTDGQFLYLAMEYVPGRTLRELLKERGRLSPADALDIIEGVLAGLAAAHEAGIVHRDVKPENVLLTNNNLVKVADFGLARAAAAASRTKTGMIIGTAAYLAPEQVSRSSSDARTDVYAAGIMLFELLTGQQPHSGGSPLDIAYKHVNDAVPAPSSLVSGLPPALDALVALATCRDPDRRPADASHFLHAISDVRNGLPIGSQPPGGSIPGGSMPGGLAAGGAAPGSGAYPGGDPYPAAVPYGSGGPLTPDPLAGGFRSAADPLSGSGSYPGGSPLGGDPYASAPPGGPDAHPLGGPAGTGAYSVAPATGAHAAGPQAGDQPWSGGMSSSGAHAAAAQPGDQPWPGTQSGDQLWPGAQPGDQPWSGGTSSSGAHAAAAPPGDQPWPGTQSGDQLWPGTQPRDQPWPGTQPGNQQPDNQLTSQLSGPGTPGQALALPGAEPAVPFPWTGGTQGGRPADFIPPARMTAGAPGRGQPHPDRLAGQPGH